MTGCSRKRPRAPVAYNNSNSTSSTSLSSSSPTSSALSEEQGCVKYSDAQFPSSATGLTLWESSSPPTRRRRLPNSSFSTSSSWSQQKSRHSARTPSPVFPVLPVQPESTYGPTAPPRHPPPVVVLSPVRPPPRVVQSYLPNPFEDDIDQRRLITGHHRVIAETEVNGYIKIRKCYFTQGTTNDEGNGSACRPISYKLSAFPRYWYSSLNTIDKRLFEFYIGAWCDGRTVLKKTNCWLKDIAQMAASEACVKHAIFALAGTYVVDYQPDEQLEQAAQLHYKRAVLSLSLLLSNARQQPSTSGDGDALVAAMALLSMIDVVSPEQRRPRNQLPRWLQGARLACQVLDMTDPGYRYREPENIQPSDARMGNAIISSRGPILALPMSPLDLANTNQQQFAWLLQGSEECRRRIHGGCGMSPMLLHRFSQITHMAALFHHDRDDSEFVTIPMAEMMLVELNNLCQWYEHEKPSGAITAVSIDVRTIGHLLSSGHLDTNGAIRTREGMTASTAEAWRLAAIVYLLCRLLRLPRNHPEVLSQVSSLAACIRAMPTSGFIFTAQAPFFPVFLLSIVAVEEEHSQCALLWFHSVTRTICRSSIPPAFEALERIRAWMATEFQDAPLPVPSCVKERHAWWEDVVDRVAKTEGTLCLV